MELFPKSNKQIFRRRTYVKDNDSDYLKGPEDKWRLEQWQRVTQHRTDNEEALGHEMTQTLGEVSSFLRRLELAALVLRKARPRDWARDRHFNDQLLLGHTLMANVKELLDLEDTGLRLSKSFRTSSTKSFEDGTIQKSLGNISQCSRFSSEIKDLLHKFDHVLNRQQTFLPYKLQEFERVEMNEEKANFTGEVARDGLQFLTERLAKDNIQPVFKSRPLKPSDLSYIVTCTVFNISVDGKASEKMAAKKMSAIKMLEKLLDVHLKNLLPAQITPLTEKEVGEAVAIICETERYDEVLAALCEERRRPAPCYQAKGHHVTCTTLGLTGSAVYTNNTVARRAAARQVLLQLHQKPKY